MGKVIKIADWEPDKVKRLQKKRKRARVACKLNEFLKRADRFFELANKKRELRLDGDKQTHT